MRAVGIRIPCASCDLCAREGWYITVHVSRCAYSSTSYIWYTTAGQVHSILRSPPNSNIEPCVPREGHQGSRRQISVLLCCGSVIDKASSNRILQAVWVDGRHPEEGDVGWGTLDFPHRQHCASYNVLRTLHVRGLTHPPKSTARGGLLPFLRVLYAASFKGAYQKNTTDFYL